MLTLALLSLLASVSVFAFPQPLGQRASSTPCQANSVTPQYGFFGGITDGQFDSLLTRVRNLMLLLGVSIEIHYWGLDTQLQLVDPEHAVTTSFNATFEVCVTYFKQRTCVE